jgi:DNA-binding NtrC family response regulator
MANERLVARSRAMRALLLQVRRFAASDATVLVTGETGTGKNAVARELHARSPRSRQPFVTIDCASLSPNLVDAELFGHERGAFTDAVAARAGRFELADEGTVYLDAVTELPLAAQGKLLRIVEEKRVERLGGHLAHVITARIVASGDASIEDRVRDGSFRHDLYHRLRVLPVLVPPLRSRVEDVLPLSRYFLGRAAAAAGRKVPVISREAAEALRGYWWPGNVRELRHAVQLALLAAPGTTIEINHLPQEVLEVPPAGEDPDEAVARPTLKEIERRYIAATLRHVQGNQTRAAVLLGISRKALWEKRRRYGLE